MAKNSIRKAYYDAPEGQIHYRYLPSTTKDATKSPILCFHMCPTSSLYFEELMIRCADEGYDCYAPDMPGLVFLIFILVSVCEVYLVLVESGIIFLTTSGLGLVVLTILHTNRLT
jgi:hypothetical protein